MSGSSPRRFVLIPGAGGAAWYWHRVVPLLQAAGHQALAVDLPGDDPEAGLATYRTLVLAAIGADREAVLVAQSMGGFTAAEVAARVPLGALVFVNAMVPRPGETPGQWWENTGSEAARTAAADRGGYSRDLDLDTYFCHDLTAGVRAELARHDRDETAVAFGSPCAFTTWPALAVGVVAGAEDRLFPPDFQRRVARERLGVEATVLPGGHLMALSRPEPLAAHLLSVATATG